jgi:GntR family transcriptional repressor for pyruvate dehydrogenase complex
MPGVIEKSVGQHIVIADALLAGDGETAAAGYRSHLEHVRDTTIQSVANARKSPE